MTGTRCPFAAFSTCFDPPRPGSSRSLSSPRVANGHVAAWVGVGGVGVGPNSTDSGCRSG